MIIKQTHDISFKRNKPDFEDSSIELFSSLNPDPHPNIFSVIHETIYRYSSPVSNSRHLYRLLPVHDIDQAVIRYQFSTSVDGEVRNFNGSFGNHASFMRVKEEYSELRIESKSVVAVSKPDIDLEFIHQPRTLPSPRMPWDRQMLQAYLQPAELPESELFELSAYAMEFVEKNQYDTFSVLKDINETIFKTYTYKPHSTTLTTSPYQTFLSKQGVCQDFTTLFICLARLINIPARYRMGYLYTGKDYQSHIVADESHAWVEVFLPYLGWVGFDPTNGTMVEKNHIRVACGRYYNDATPTSGAIFNASPGTKETLETKVKVVQLNSDGPK